MGLLNFFIRGEQVFFANHRSDIERFAHEIAARDVRPELEIYSAAMLEEVQHLIGLGDPRAAVRAQFRAPHADPGRHARHAGEPARHGRPRVRALGVPWEDLRINVTSMGPTQLPMTTIAMAMGFNVRVGMEDNVLYRRGEPLREQRAARRARGADRGRAGPAGRDARAGARAARRCAAARRARCPSRGELRRGCGHEAAAVRLRRARPRSTRRSSCWPPTARACWPAARASVPLMSARREHRRALVDINRLAELAELECQRRRGRRGDRALRPARPRPRGARPRWRCWPMPPRGSAIRRCATAARWAATWPSPIPPTTCRWWRIALDAELTVRSAGGERDDRRRRTSSAAAYTTALEPGELLCRVRFPGLPDGAGSAYYEVSARSRGLGAGGRGGRALAGRRRHASPARASRWAASATCRCASTSTG